MMNDDEFDLCPERIWDGLVYAVKTEKPFMGKSHKWWQELILEIVCEHCEHLVDIEILREYKA